MALAEYSPQVLDKSDRVCVDGSPVYCTESCTGPVYTYPNNDLDDGAMIVICSPESVSVKLVIPHLSLHTLATVQLQTCELIVKLRLVVEVVGKFDTITVSKYAESPLKLKSVRPSTEMSFTLTDATLGVP